MKKRVAVAGATGFIGKWFIDTFHEKYDIIALSRGEINDKQYSTVEWRQADMYSLSSTMNALQGADYALYLVHSMNPSTRMNQGSFENTDLLLADNFARSAEACGLQQIIFVGGILPKETSEYSVHLRSRFETEQTLGSRTVALTTLRAGIVIGPGGSSFKVVEELVKSLPIMACPQWCKSPSEPVDVKDMLHFIDKALGNEQVYGQAIELGGAETTTYMKMLEMTAEQLGKKRWIFSIPFFTLGFSKLWVALFSKTSTTFISPLIESLRHDMRTDKTQPFHWQGTVVLEESVRCALRGKAPSIKRSYEKEEERNTVRSVQRLSNPRNKSAKWIADMYPKWLDRYFRFILTATVKGDLVRFYLFNILLLQLNYMPDRSDDNRSLFYITGGVLSKRNDMGWLEFRSVLGNKHIISAIHRFVPSLPWYIYKFTQAIGHLFVMDQFDRFLKKQR